MRHTPKRGYNNNKTGMGYGPVGRVHTELYRLHTNTIQSDVAIHTCNPNKRIEGQGHPLLRGEFVASVGYMKPCI